MEGKSLELKRKYQSLVRSLTYISMVCRPDISFQINMLQSSKPLVSHLNAGKRCIKYLLNTRFLGLKYPKTVEKYEVEAFLTLLTHLSCEDIVSRSSLIYYKKAKTSKYQFNGSGIAGLQFRNKRTRMHEN
eukprot:maker-scaffold_26-snap-gene-3.5-mRNA-1 protein AED:0.37 eAED:0.58 QI:0/0/0/1/0/0/3/0/130